MKKFVCLITALFLLISALPSSATAAMVNPKTAYSQDFENADTPFSVGFKNFTQAALYRSTIVSASTDALYVQDFNYDVKSAADAGVIVDDANNVASRSYNGKMVIDKTKTGNSTTDKLDLSSYLKGIDSYTIKFDLSADFSGSSMVIYHGAGFSFEQPVNNQCEIKYHVNGAWQSTDKKIDLTSAKVVYITVSTVDGTKYAQLKIGNEIIVEGVPARKDYSFDNISFVANGGLKGQITVDNIKITQNDVTADANKSMKMWKYNPGSYSYLLNVENYVNDKDYEIEFNLTPKLTNGSIAFFAGSMYQLEYANNEYSVKYRNAGDSTMNETSVKDKAIGTPIKIKLVVNRATDSTDFYADGNLVQSGVPRRNDGNPSNWYDFSQFGITLNNGMRGAVYIDDIKLTCDSVNEITLSKSDEKYAASAYVQNSVLVLAAYSNNGAVLENVVFSTDNNKSVELSLPANDEFTYKAFIFDNLSNLKPLCDVESYGDADL